MKLLKFGGGVLNTAESLERLFSIVCNIENAILVISAFDKTTSELEKLYLACINKKDVSLHLQGIKDFFEQFFIYLKNNFKDFSGEICSYFLDLDLLINKILYQDFDCAKQNYYNLLAWGELISSNIVFYFLKLKSWKQKVELIDARSFIKLKVDLSKDEYKVDFGLTKSLVSSCLKEKNSIIITQGFIASDCLENTLLLGKEGSDYSAAILAYCLDLKKVTLYKNVSGIMTCNFNFFSPYKKIDKLSFKDLKVIVDHGSEIVHTKAVSLLQCSNINLFIKNFYHSNEIGTLVSNRIKKSILNYCTFVVKCLFISVPINSSLNKSFLENIKLKIQKYKFTVISYELNKKFNVIIVCKRSSFNEIREIYANIFFDVQFNLAIMISFFGYLSKDEVFWLKKINSLSFVMNKGECFIIINYDFLNFSEKDYEKWKYKNIDFYQFFF